ncbi:MAG: 23S rRNA (adenine(2503)-C(2))-methyltransferase RlmN [Acidobacteria bacterium]|nr:23S rRNA (adenine(2503)-C(2))-methyltransferase RlmN [Acidobacteriota bacterium]
MRPDYPIPAGNLLGLDRTDLERLAVDRGRPAYRGRQIYRGIYERRAREFAGMTDLDRSFRAWLSAHHRIDYPSVQERFVSRDGAVRYLLRLEDGQTIEAVSMPEGRRTTLCLSSQVGCAVDCRFCFTALLGVKRNLTAGEILGQVLALTAGESIAHGSRLNVVFMGMGEPLLNLGPVMKAVRIMADPQGLALSLRRITISTAGITSRISDLAREPLRPKLAVSLNASTEEQRTALMPLNRKYPLDSLLEACRNYPLRPWEKLTFEYVMLDGVNDSDQDAARVANLVQGIRAKVNLIPYNPGPELAFRPSPLERVLAFQQVLTRRRIPAFIRISRGQDVRAACGQLSLEGLTAGTPPPGVT